MLRYGYVLNFFLQYKKLAVDYMSQLYDVENVPNILLLSQ